MNIIFILLGLIALLAIEGAVYFRYWPRGIKAQVAFSKNRAMEGDAVEVCETVEYTGRLPLPWVRMKFQVSRDIRFPDAVNAIVTDYYNREEVFSIGRMEKVVRRLPVYCDRRGQHRVFGIDVVSSDMFLTRKMIVSFSGSSAITVYPKYTHIPQLIDNTRQIIGDRIVKRAKIDDPFVFKGVREYVPGDQMSRINWRASARTDQLAVNQYEYTSSMCVSIWLNIEEAGDRRDLSLTEECIRIAATLLSTMIDDGIPVSLYCNGMDCGGQQGIRIAHGSSEEHRDNCLTALARLDTEKDSLPFMGFVDSIPDSASDDELVILISSQAGYRLCDHISTLAAERELFWIAPVRTEDDIDFPEMRRLKNRCVWRVDCER